MSKNNNFKLFINDSYFFENRTSLPLKQFIVITSGVSLILRVRVVVFSSSFRAIDNSSHLIGSRFDADFLSAGISVSLD
jgi:hypothetical protein